LKDDELNSAKTELEHAKQRLSSATDRIGELEGELDVARAELQSVKSGLDVGMMELKGVRVELEEAREENVRLQKLNTVVVTKLGMHSPLSAFFPFRFAYLSLCFSPICTLLSHQVTTGQKKTGLLELRSSEMSWRWLGRKTRNYRN
jgi:hypothetical protein